MYHVLHPIPTLVSFPFNTILYYVSSNSHDLLVCFYHPFLTSCYPPHHRILVALIIIFIHCILLAKINKYTWPSRAVSASGNYTTVGTSTYYPFKVKVTTIIENWPQSVSFYMMVIPLFRLSFIDSILWIHCLILLPLVTNAWSILQTPLVQFANWNKESVDRHNTLNNHRGVGWIRSLSEMRLMILCTKKSNCKNAIL